MKRVGFIGLGLMGAPMAANVARAGYPLVVYNRSPEKAEPLMAFGARVAGSPKEVAESSDVLITMLADGAAVEGILSGPEGFLAGASDGMVWIDMSTIAPKDTRRFAQACSARGVKMLDAPVMGSTGPAAQGSLQIMVGGEQEVFEEQRDLLDVLGKDLYYLGPQGSGTQLKLSMNLMVAAQLASLSEALALAAKAGLDLSTVGQVIAGSGIASNLITRKITNIVKDDFSPAFSLKHMQKDLGLLIRTADTLNVSLPVAGVIHQLFTASKAQGDAEKDSSAIYRLIAELAGLSRSST